MHYISTITLPARNKRPFSSVHGRFFLFSSCINMYISLARALSLTPKALKALILPLTNCNTHPPTLCNKQCHVLPLNEQHVHSGFLCNRTNHKTIKSLLKPKRNALGIPEPNPSPTMAGRWANTK